MTFIGCTPTHLVQALGIAPGEDGAIPSEIQWMPPGRHEICATKGGKPAKLTVMVDAITADAVARSFADLVKSGKRPYLDFNHAGGASSGRVTAVRWAGDDPKTGGIRAAVEWSDEGAKAITGRTYFSFSPTFLLDAAGKVIGTTANMGGLVNEPAFTAIAPVAASSSNHEQPMKALLAALVAAKLIPSADLEDEAAASAVTASMKTLTDKVAASETRITALEGEVKAAARTRAEALVEAAAREGRIPPKDTKTREYWVNSIVTAGTPAEEALKATPVNPALAVQARESVRTGGSGASDASVVSAQNTEIAAVRAANPKLSYADAFAQAARQKPDLFKA